MIILADQLASAADQAGTTRKALFKENTGELSMPSIFEVGSTSAGEMFLGAFVPGLVLVGLYMAYILISALLKPDLAPAVKMEGKFDAAFWKKVVKTGVCCDFDFIYGRTRHFCKMNIRPSNSDIDTRQLRDT